MSNAFQVIEETINFIYSRQVNYSLGFKRFVLLNLLENKPTKPFFWHQSSLLADFKLFAKFIYFFCTTSLYWWQVKADVLSPKSQTYYIQLVMYLTLLFLQRLCLKPTIIEVLSRLVAFKAVFMANHYCNFDQRLIYRKP